MIQITPQLRAGYQDGIIRRIQFWCPGCDEPHAISVKPKGHGGHGWEWNENPACPTTTPSILVTCGHYSPGHNPEKGCWCTYKVEHPDCEFECSCCHSYLTDGKIQFLNDCTHHLAGQTVPLPEYVQ